MVTEGQEEGPRCAASWSAATGRTVSLLKLLILGGMPLNCRTVSDLVLYGHPMRGQIADGCVDIYHERHAQLSSGRAHRLFGCPISRVRARLPTWIHYVWRIDATCGDAKIRSVGRPSANAHTVVYRAGTLCDNSVSALGGCSGNAARFAHSRLRIVC